MFCTKCGTELPNDAAFCPQCGEKAAMETSQDSMFVEQTVALNNEENLLNSEQIYNQPVDNAIPTPKVITQDVAEQATNSPSKSKAPIIAIVAVIAFTIAVIIGLVVANPFSKPAPSADDYNTVTNQTQNVNVKDYIDSNGNIRLSAFTELDGNGIIDVTKELGYSWNSGQGFVGESPEYALVMARQDGSGKSLSESEYSDIPIIGGDSLGWTWKAKMNPSDWDTTLAESNLGEPIYEATGVSNGTSGDTAALAVFEDANGNAIIVSAVFNDIFTQVNVSNEEAFDDNQPMVAFSQNIVKNLAELPRRISSNDGFVWTVKKDGYFDTVKGTKSEFNPSDYTDEIGDISLDAFIELNGEQLAQVMKQAGFKWDDKYSEWKYLPSTKPSESLNYYTPASPDDIYMFDSIDTLEEAESLPALGDNEAPVCYFYEFNTTVLTTFMSESSYSSFVTHQALDKYEERQMFYVVKSDSGNDIAIFISWTPADSNGNATAKAYIYNDAYVAASKDQAPGKAGIANNVDNIKNKKTVIEVFDSMTPYTGNNNGWEIQKEPPRW